MFGLHEALKKIKRKWKDYPEQYVSDRQHPIRDSSVLYLGNKDKQRMPLSEFKEYLSNLHDIGLCADRVSDPDAYIRKSRFLTTINIGKQKYAKLTNLGKRLYNYLVAEIETNEAIKNALDIIRALENEI